jgi:hypothetical protein
MGNMLFLTYSRGPIVMAKESKEIVLEIDADTYSMIEEFCDHMNQDGKAILNRLVDESLKEFASNYENLKNGYVEMGNINLEISDAFTVSENEALDHIKKSD